MKEFYLGRRGDEDFQSTGLIRRGPHIVGCLYWYAIGSSNTNPEAV